MALEVKSSILHELVKYGLKSTDICHNCGMCAAVCFHEGTGQKSFRIALRLLQLGLKDKLIEKSEIWLCDVCDECAAVCPRGNDLGKTMTALRHWYSDHKDDMPN